MPLNKETNYHICMDVFHTHTHTHTHTHIYIYIYKIIIIINFSLMIVHIKLEVTDVWCSLL